MNKHNIIPTALTAGLIAMLAMPSLASARHGRPEAPRFASGASCSLPDDDPWYAQDRRESRVERRLKRRMKAVREDVRGAVRAMEGLSHWTVDRQLGEARRRVTEARQHLRNESFRAAERTLDRVEVLVEKIVVKAQELSRIRTAARSEMREYRRNLSLTQAKVDEADCTVAAGHLRKAEGAFARAQREAGDLDWDTARTYARRANGHQRDALVQARKTIELKRMRREYEDAISTLEHDLSKARKAGARGADNPAARALLADARRLRSQAKDAARSRRFAEATRLAKRGVDRAQGAFELAVTERRRERRRARHARGYDSEMPFASASARWTSSAVW